MPEPSCCFYYFLWRFIDLNLYLSRDCLFCLFPIASLTISRLPPTIYLIIFINCDWVIGPTCDEVDWILLQHFNIFVLIVFEEMRNHLRRWNCLNVLQQPKLALKSSSPTEDIANVAQCERMEHTACNWNYFFITEFGDLSRRWSENAASKSQRSKVTFPKSEENTCSCDDDIMLLSTFDFQYFISF